MDKRQLIINGYKTAEAGLWTLASLKITKASQVQTFVSVPGRFAPLDLSTALTDGEPYYGSARLDAVLESSEGTREERQARIAEMVNTLDGYLVQIIHPDHPDHYMQGRVQFTPEYNDLVHARVKLTAVCDAWLYSKTQTSVKVTATSSAKTANLVNSGRLSSVPTLEVTGEVNITYGAYSWALSAGVYQLPELYLTPGTHKVSYSGSGSVTFNYREGVLAE